MKTYISSNEQEVIFHTDCDGYKVMHYIRDEVKHHK